jgi:hypothetical protein
VDTSVRPTQLPLVAKSSDSSSLCKAMSRIVPFASMIRAISEAVAISVATD